MYMKPFAFYLSFCLWSSIGFSEAKEDTKKIVKASPSYDFYELTGKNSFKIKFLAEIKPAGSFEGRATEATGDLLIDRNNEKVLFGRFTVPIESLVTGNNMRDRHMKEKYLEVKKKGMPSHISLIVEPSSYKKEKEKKLSIPVRWQIHGKEKNMTIEGNRIKLPEKADGKIEIDASFMLNLKDFSIKQPSYLVVWMEEEVKVNIQLKLSYQGKKTLEEVQNSE